MEPDGDDVLLTPSEVALLFGVDPKTIARWSRAACSLPFGPQAVTVASEKAKSAHASRSRRTRTKADSGNYCVVRRRSPLRQVNNSDAVARNSHW